MFSMSTFKEELIFIFWKKCKGLKIHEIAHYTVENAEKQIKKSYFYRIKRQLERKVINIIDAH